MKLNLSTRNDAFCKARMRIRNADGTLARGWSKWIPNLILNVGLDALATRSFAQMLYSANVGTDNTPTSKTTAAAGVTLSMAGTTVTATGSFFASTDVGAIIKFGASGAGGNEYTITAFTSATQVTVGASGTDSGAATVWQVQQTNCFAYYSTTTTTYTADSITFDATGGGSGIPQWTFVRSLQFPAVAANVTFKELTFGYGGGSGVNQWSRVVVPGAGDALVTGQIYEVQYTLVVKFPGGAAQAAVGDTSGGTWNTAGTYMFESLAGNNIISTTIGNAIYDGTYVDPGNVAKTALATATWTQRTLASATALTLPSVVIEDSSTQDAYSNGTYVLTSHSHYNIGSAVATIYGIALGNQFVSGNGVGATIKFTTPIAKDNSHTLDLTHTRSWARILTN